MSEQANRYGLKVDQWLPRSEDGEDGGEVAGVGGSANGWGAALWAAVLT